MNIPEARKVYDDAWAAKLDEIRARRGDLIPYEAHDAGVQAVAEWAQREALTALGELRAAYGDVEARLIAAEAAIKAAHNDLMNQDIDDDEAIGRALNRLTDAPSTVLADHDKEVAAHALEEAAEATHGPDAPNGWTDRIRISVRAWLTAQVVSIRSGSEGNEQ